MRDASFARPGDPPYYAVVFASRRREGGAGPDDGYGPAAERMVELAATCEGFLGIESARDADGFGITVSYWASEAAIRAWRDDVEHTLTRGRGRAEWYDRYDLRVARVERAYGWDVTG